MLKYLPPANELQAQNLLFRSPLNHNLPLPTDGQPELHHPAGGNPNGKTFLTSSGAWDRQTVGVPTW